jgi:dTDP-4-dehydrorhamnose reductase
VAGAFRCRVIFFSSSYVFDGNSAAPYTVWDTPHPLQQYGIHKLISEKAVLSNQENVVIRTVGVFGDEDARKNFACQVLDSLSAGEPIHVPEDQTFNPIESNNLANLSVRMAESGFSGLLHIAGQEVVSKYDFALDVAQMFSLDRSMIHPVSGHKRGTAIRPKNACLVNSVQANNYEDSLRVFYNAQ